MKNLKLSDHAVLRVARSMKKGEVRDEFWPTPGTGEKLDEESVFNFIEKEISKITQGGIGRIGIKLSDSSGLETEWIPFTDKTLDLLSTVAPVYEDEDEDEEF